MKGKTLEMVQMALFIALIILMASVPFLGYIPLGFTRATIIHIPVIVGSIVMGPKKGAMLGGVFGLTSFINNTFNPTITSFVFTPFYTMGEIKGGWQSIVICFLPRILVGVVPYFVYHIFLKLFKKKKMALALGISGVVGSLTNTILVMNFIYVFFGDVYAELNKAATKTVYGFILLLIGKNGIPEAIIAAVVVAFLAQVLLKTKMFKEVKR